MTNTNVFLDQFYTNEDVAIQCIEDFQELYNFDNFDIILEPSAGSGNFFFNLPENKRIGVDLDPKHEDITEMDFMDYVPVENQRYATIGNPPFGRISSLAIKFFNQAAQFSDVIAFIIPRTFKRISVQNKLDMNFHLVKNIDLPMKPCCFTPNMSAKCCFQIWERREIKREKIILLTTHKDFEFKKWERRDKDGNLLSLKDIQPPKDVDFAMKSAGGNCGEVVVNNLEKLRPKSWLWIKSVIDKDVLIDRFSQLDYSMSTDTVRQDSLGKADLIYLYTQFFNDINEDETIEEITEEIIDTSDEETCNYIFKKGKIKVNNVIN